MFTGCISLTKAPALPATTLSDYCYPTMFSGCISLIQIPALPATTLASNCYTYMFERCTALKLSSTKTVEYAQEYRIPTTGTGTTATDALTNMFVSTGGTFTGTPAINTTYYLSTDNMIVRDTEVATLNGYVGSMIDNSVSNPLNITGATVGQIAKITAVDESGKPTSWEAADIYEKPASGIPKSDLANDVQTSLNKADTSISYDSQTLTEAQQKQARDNIGAGQPIFAVNVTGVGGSGGYTADKTAAEIEAAYQAGRTIVCKTQARFIIGDIPVELPLVSRNQERVFIFSADQLMGENAIFTITVNISDSKVEVSTKGVEIYEKPASGIPKSDLADDVQTSLAKADTAISLGLTSATPGQIIKVKTVQDGKPTEWEAVDMDAGKFPKFQKLLTHTITEDELAASPIAFMWGTAQIPNLNDFNVFVLTIVRPDGAKIEFSKWVKLKINNTLFGNICGTSTAASPQYTITANRLFGVWISGNYYDPRNIGVPVLVPPRSSSTYHSDLPDSEPVTSIGFTSYVADYGLTAGIVVEIWGAK